MKVSELKDIASALGRYATIRETALPPESLIGVQVVNDELKLIAGNSRAGMVISGITAFSMEDQRFTISARPFLQAAKVLPARTEVKIEVEKDMLLLVAEGGGRVECPAIGNIKDAGFAKKPKDFKAEGEIDGAQWKHIGKLFTEVSARVEVPCVQHVEGYGYATAVAPLTKSRYVSIRFRASGPEGYSAAGYKDFWSGLVSLSDTGVLKWGLDGVLASSGRFECFTAPYLNSRYNPESRTSSKPVEYPAWPILRVDGELPMGFTHNRRDLITIIKGQSPFDEHKRITLEVDTDFVKITPFGEETGQRFPAQTFDRGIRSVSAEYLSGLLSSLDSKEVTLRWGGRSKAVSVIAPGYEDWTLLIAPVGL